MSSIDKVYHFLAGLIITVFLGFVVDPMTAFGGAVAAGVAKECYDHYTYGLFDWADLAATIIGGCVGYTLWGWLG